MTTDSKPASPARDPRFAAALALRDAGQPEAAVQQLETLLADGQRHAAVTGTLGTLLLYEMGAPERAIPYLQETVFRSPRSEAASLALFHAFLDSHQSERAGDEARRFLSLKDSSRYRDLLRATSRGGQLEEMAWPLSDPPQGDEAPVAAGSGAPTAPPVARPRLAAALVVETSRLGEEPYRLLADGLEQTRRRRQIGNGLHDRLDLFLVTFAGRVAAITEIPKNGPPITGASLVATGRGGFCLQEPSGLLSALDLAAETLAARFVEQQSDDWTPLRPWLVALTAAETVVTEGERAEQLSSRLRQDPGIQLFPVLLGDQGDPRALATLAGRTPLRLRDQAIDTFFVWLSEALAAALQASAPGAEARLPAPTWGTAVDAMASSTRNR